MKRWILAGGIVLLTLTGFGCGLSSEIKNDPLFQEPETVYTAAAAGDLEGFEFYRNQRGWDPQVADYNGVLPLCYAAQGGNLEIIWHMVNDGADVNEPDLTGKTPLQYAREAGNEEAVQYLQELGATK